MLRVPAAWGDLKAGSGTRRYPDLHAFLVKMHRYTMLEAGLGWRPGRRPRRRDPWIAPPREVFRRLVWKQDSVDGPEGWAFCLLSGLSEWVLADRHRRLWAAEIGDCPNFRAARNEVGDCPLPKPRTLFSGHPNRLPYLDEPGLRQQP